MTDSGLERKFAASGCPCVEDDTHISGYASLFGEVDQGGDRVMAGAYRETLARIAAQGGSVKMLWQHDPAQPIGIWEDIREDPKGLFVRGRLLPDVARAREALILIRAGAIDGLSIGFQTRTATKDAAGHRMLTGVDLWEISLVTFPMLPSARIDAKSDPQPVARVLAQKIRQAARDFAQVSGTAL